ncbi:MAG: ATP-dependent DNA helicase RecG [Acidobacteria bacterium]|nr:MAG: ATP-dependent DNA helicase RecG [Acidobacteriota bacterium]
MIQPMPGAISLNTRIEDLHSFKIARLGQTLSRKLAAAVADYANKTSYSEATVEDLLSYLPFRYEDRSHLSSIKDLHIGMETSIELTVKLSGGYQVRNRRVPGKSRLFIFEVSAIDAERTGRPVMVWWFVSGRHCYEIVKYYTEKLKRGTRFVTFGRWDWDSRRGTYALRLQKPADELEIIVGLNSDGDEEQFNPDDSEENASDPSLSAIHVARRVPVYRKLGNFNSKRIREIVYSVLQELEDSSMEEILPADLLQRLKLLDRGKALREIHFPPKSASMSEYEKARSPAHVRLIFEDFFWLSFAIGLQRGKRTRESKSRKVKIDKAVKEAVAVVLPFKLTGAQRKVTLQIFNDMKSGAPMNRLLQGDVGSGKTIVALIAMIAAMENGLQTALMAPTEILAEQHARNLKRLLAKTPYRVELLTGSLRPAEKRRLQAALKAGEIQACIGTQALIQEAVSFSDLGLVVIDEQHRFGVMQRAELRARGLNPDVLVMTATPIPRSLAMTVYGDLDVSVIDELPPGRTPIDTKVFGEDQRQEVKRLISREVRAGHQAYVVYPLVEESEKMDLKDATRRFQYLRDTVFPKFSVGLLHGKMKPAEKDDVMKKFVGGQIQILVSTTVVEVGVDVPNASVMIIEHAERFGLSQLHQLRGRVGRGADKSYCVLLTSDRQTAIARERLGIMEKSSDGFVIAERDLELRGPGELLGTRQSGIPELRVGNLVRDQQLLEKARNEAEMYLNKENSPITAKMIQHVTGASKFGLAAVG